MNIFSSIFSELSGYKSIREAISKKISPVSVTGLSHIHRAHLIHALSGEKINLVITGSEPKQKSSATISTLWQARKRLCFSRQRNMFSLPLTAPTTNTNICVSPHFQEQFRATAELSVQASRLSCSRLSLWESSSHPLSN